MDYILLSINGLKLLCLNFLDGGGEVSMESAFTTKKNNK